MKWIRSWLQTAASKARGAVYPLDDRIPLSALLMLSGRRLVWALRGVTWLLTFKRRGGLLFMGRRVEIRCSRLLCLGRGVTLDESVLVDALSQEGVRIGDGVSIGRHSIIRCTGSLSNIGVGVSIGSGSGMDAYAFIGAAGGVHIGRNVIMGQHVSFHAEDHLCEDLTRPIKEQATKRLGITIGDDCWVGSNVTFLDGTRVGCGCVIGAGSVIRGEIPDNAVAVGVPARVVRMRGQGT